MGEMADYYAEQALMDEFERQLEIEREYQNRKKYGGKKMGQAILYTEDVLNRKAWVTGNGEYLEVAQMDESHIRNTLQFLYKKRDKYWLNCRDGKLIEQFENGEDFFQRVIRNSTLWHELTSVLTEERTSGFNFKVEMGDRK
jgi:hypothetical protein